jgi:hypothetical protein
VTSTTGITAADDEAVAFEVVEQRRHRTAGDVHPRGHLAGEHRLRLALDHRERVEAGMREAEPSARGTDRVLDERADDFELPGAPAREPARARVLVFERGRFGCASR